MFGIEVQGLAKAPNAQLQVAGREVSKAQLIERFGILGRCPDGVSQLQNGARGVAILKKPLA
jgi:hypothetical protein